MARHARRIRWSGGLLLLLGWCLLVGRGVPAEQPDKTKLAGIRARMQQFVDQKLIAGAVTLVGTHDQVLSLETVGSQNLDSATHPSFHDASFPN